MTRPTVQQALDAIADVEGWMSPDQGERLFAAARRVPAGGRIVEIGSFRGRSIIVAALAAADDVEIVAIDPHAGNDRGPREIDGYEAAAAADHEAFNRNLAQAGVAHRVRHVRQFSSRALNEVNGPVDLLYIDGAHRYGPALADIRQWGDRVKPGGTMLIHDSFSSIGVTAAIARHLFASTRFTYIGRSRSMAEYRAAAPDRVGNVLRQVRQLAWFARNVGLKVLLTLKLGGVVQRITGTAPQWPY